MTHSSLRAAFCEQLYHLDIGFVADPSAAHGLPQVLRSEKLAHLIFGLELLHHQQMVVVAFDGVDSVTLPAVGALVLCSRVKDFLPLGVVFDSVPYVCPGHACSPSSHLSSEAGDLFPPVAYDATSKDLARTSGANFSELRNGEVRRISLPGTS